MPNLPVDENQAAPLTLMEAIARMEGFGADPNNIPTRCNNPGDIIAGSFANKYGAIPEAADPHCSSDKPFRYAVFPDVATGWGALQALLVRNYWNMTIEAAINKYAPPSENNTINYVDLVCEWCQVTPDTKVTADLIGMIPS